MMVDREVSSPLMLPVTKMVWQRVLGEELNSGEAEMKDDRGAFRVFEQAGEQAARKRRPKQANPYLLPARGDAAQLLDEASRKLLADAWLRGWTREMERRSS